MQEWASANWPIIVIALAALNAMSFALYSLDKSKAQKGKWRISEAALLWSAALFGGLGAFLGMQLLRHKTKHTRFAVLVPVFLVAQVLLIAAAFIF